MIKNRFEHVLTHNSSTTTKKRSNNIRQWISHLKWIKGIWSFDVKYSMRFNMCTSTYT